MVSFSRSVWKKLHRAEKIYTGCARGARNNYEVWGWGHLLYCFPVKTILDVQNLQWQSCSNNFLCCNLLVCLLLSFPKMMKTILVLSALQLREVSLVLLVHGVRVQEKCIFKELLPMMMILMKKKITHLQS